MPATTPTVRWASLAQLALVAIPFVMAFAISPTALIALGWEYVSPGGNPIEKVHPATYLLCASFLLVSMFQWGKVKTILFGRDFVAYYFFCWLILLAYAGTFLAVPFMSLIDTWLFPGCVTVLILCLAPLARKRLGYVLDLLMVANTVLGVSEFLGNWRLVPLTQWSGVLGQWVYPHEWRSTALLGHPLANSYITGTYMLAILLGLRIQTPALRVGLLLLHTMGLFAFGSRGATVFLVIAIVIMIFVELFRATQTGKIRKDILFLTGLGIPGLSLIIPAVLTSGVADKLLDRFVNDKGSAESRAIAVDVIMSFPLSSLILGSPNVLVNAILGRFGLIAIENFWLSFLLSFGIIGCVMFWPALYVLCRCMVRHTSRLHAALVIYFFACCTSSVSLASKSYSFAFVCAICLTSLRNATSKQSSKVTAPALGLPRRIEERVVSA